MINAALDLIQFFKSNFPFLFALVLYTVLAISLSKSIKKNYKAYYWIFGIISFCFMLPASCRLLGIALPFNLGRLPIIGLSSSELSSAANFIHPVLVIIMYMGAFSAKNKYVGRLMSIRKELSIIVGFPVLAHVVKRLFGTFPGGWQYFADNEAFMQNPRVTSALGSGITSFAFVLGLVMTILFLVLWVTSFDGVRRKMRGGSWKKVQRWSYALYAMLFIHSLCLNVGGMISDNARAAQQKQQAPTEMVASNHSHGEQAEAKQAPQGAPQQQAQQGGHSHGGRPKAFSFVEDVKIPKSTQRGFNIVILFAVYGSYLYFRLRKAKADKQKRS